jgi:hypothetical protein
MTRLKPRYGKHELDTLLTCIAPVENWSRDDLRAWRREGVNAAGFRHFTALNITPIEHYRPKVLQEYTASSARPRRPAQCVVDLARLIRQRAPERLASVV